MGHVKALSFVISRLASIQNLLNIDYKNRMDIDTFFKKYPDIGIEIDQLSDAYENVTKHENRVYEKIFKYLKEGDGD